MLIHFRRNSVARLVPSFRCVSSPTLELLKSPASQWKIKSFYEFMLMEFLICFILVHPPLLARLSSFSGHMSYLKKVRSSFPDPIHLVVGVCSDETVESYKRFPPTPFNDTSPSSPLTFSTESLS